MLNPAFPYPSGDEGLGNYILPRELSERTSQGNAALNTGPERRVQRVFTFEIWTKLKALRLSNLAWPKLRVLDVCCGTGFLSYHLLSKVLVEELMLLDTSEMELKEAETLLMKKFPHVRISYRRWDLLKNKFPPSSFDLIIGNSFLHHLHDLPCAIGELYRLLRPGGMFATLHEPTPVAIAYESGSWDLICQLRRQGAAYVELLRKSKAASDGSVIDVWLFEGERLATLFSAEGFEAIRVIPWNLLRPILVARSKLHLDALKPALSPWEQILFAIAILSDAGLRRCLPADAFGALSLAACKPPC